MNKHNCLCMNKQKLHKVFSICFIIVFFRMLELINYSVTKWYRTNIKYLAIRIRNFEINIKRDSRLI